MLSVCRSRDTFIPGVMERLSLLYYITSLRQVLFQGNFLLLAGLGVETESSEAGDLLAVGEYKEAIIYPISYIRPCLTLGHGVR